MAMTPTAVAVGTSATPPTRHVGAGIARRDAHHERQRRERAEVEAQAELEAPGEQRGADGAWPLIINICEKNNVVDYMSNCTL